MARNTQTVSFGLGGGSPLAYALAPQAVQSPTMRIANQALEAGTSSAPVQSWGEGATRLGQALLGGFFAGRERKRGEEAAGRLADSVLQAMPEAQRNGPQGQALAAALRDPDLRTGLLPQLLQNIGRQPEAPAGYRYQPDGSLQFIPGGPEDPAVRDANRDDVIMVDGRPYSRRALLGQGGGAMPQPQGQPAPVAVPGAAVPGSTDAAQIDATLAQIQGGESAGNPNAQPRDPRTGQPILDAQGRPIAYGLYQFTPDTWQGVSARHPELRLTPGGIADPEQQQRAAQAHAQDILRRFQPYIGRPGPNGQPITPDMLIRGAWIGGEAGLQRYLESNGQRNPRDVFGTSIGDYFHGTARNLRPMQTAQAGPGAPAPSRLRGQPVPGTLPMGQDAPAGSTPVPMAGQPQAAPAAAAPAAEQPREVREFLPDRRGQVSGITPPRMEPGGIMARPAPGALVPGPTRDQIATAREIRNSHLGQQQVKDSQRIVNVLSSMENAVTRNTAASDLNLVYGLMTILDPGSVVREGETVMVTGTQSVPQQLQGLINRVLNGEAALGAEGRQAIMAEARSRAQSQMESYNWLRDNDEDFLAQNGYRPEGVLGRRLALPPPRQAPAPAGGTSAPTARAAPVTPQEQAGAQAELERRRAARGQQ